MAQVYNIAGVLVPYTKSGIDETILKTTVGKRTILNRTGEKSPIGVVITDVTFDFKICYTQDDGREGSCYWYTFFNRQSAAFVSALKNALQIAAC